MIDAAIATHLQALRAAGTADGLAGRSWRTLFALGALGTGGSRCTFGSIRPRRTRFALGSLWADVPDGNAGLAGLAGALDDEEHVRGSNVPRQVDRDEPAAARQVDDGGHAAVGLTC